MLKNAGSTLSDHHMTTGLSPFDVGQLLFLFSKMPQVRTMLAWLHSKNQIDILANNLVTVVACSCVTIFPKLIQRMKYS